MIGRLISIIFIYVCVVVAWMVLGSTMFVRSTTQDEKLRGAVGSLWGAEQRQSAPSVWHETKQEKERKRIVDGKTATEIETETIRHDVPLESSHVQVDLKLEHRRKGLLWYPTYWVRFDSRYQVANHDAVARVMWFQFVFPTSSAVYDDFQFKVNGQPLKEIQIADGQVRHAIPLEAGETKLVEIAYRSQGMQRWWYNFGSRVSQVKSFRLTMTTDFAKIDFPQNSISPSSKTPTVDGWKLEWQYQNLLTGVEIGMEMPRKLNPGPWVGQVTFFAPVSLFLFFFLLWVFTALRQVTIHPMNYFFMGAAFFSFHLLMAYLVDHVALVPSFVISAAVSVFLVVSYMRLVVGARVAFVEVALAQLVYLVLFSSAFFWEGFTGLTITVLCIATLFVVMQMTGRTDWTTVFGKSSSRPQEANPVGPLSRSAKTGGPG